MTKEFAELTNRLARAHNMDGGTYVLITDCPDETEIRISIQGRHVAIMYGVCEVLKMVLNDSSDEEAAIYRERLKNVIIADEEKRFRRGVEK